MAENMTPGRAFSEWCRTQPKCPRPSELDDMERADLLERYHEDQSKRMHMHNQQAMLHGHRAGWAFREIAKLEAEADKEHPDADRLEDADLRAREEGRR